VISPTTKINSMAASANYLYAITEQCVGNNVNCSNWRLERTLVSTTKWVSLPLPTPLSKYASVMSLTAFGSDVWLSTMDQVSKPWNSYIATSHNLGASFKVAVQPLLISVTACGITATSQKVLWAICDEGNMQGQIPYSSDGGSHWTVYGTNQVLSHFGFGAFDPINSRLAVAVNGNYPRTLFGIANSSAPPTVMGKTPRGSFATSLCFVNPTQGVLLSDGNGMAPVSTLWYTNDGGAHWNKIAP